MFLLHAQTCLLQCLMKIFLENFKLTGHRRNNFQNCFENMSINTVSPVFYANAAYRKSFITRKTCITCPMQYLLLYTFMVNVRATSKGLVFFTFSIWRTNLTLQAYQLIQVLYLLVTSSHNLNIKVFTWA